MHRKGLAVVIAITAPSTASHEKCAWLLGMQLENQQLLLLQPDQLRGYFQLSASRGITSPQNYAFLTWLHFCSYCQRLLGIQSLALWTVASSVEAACQFAARLALFCRDTAVLSPCILK